MPNAHNNYQNSLDMMVLPHSYSKLGSPVDLLIANLVIYFLSFIVIFAETGKRHFNCL